VNELSIKDRKYTLFAVMAGYFLTGFMGSAMVVAVPVIALNLQMSVTMTGWVISGFVLASAILLMPAGRFADYLGYPAVFKAGMASFAAATLACGFAPSGEFLIVFRFLQGSASALIYCSGMALISCVYPPEERGRAIGWVTFTVYTGLSVGPVIGGFLNELYGWRSILHVTWVLATLVAVYSFATLQPVKGREGKVSDYRGMLLFMLMVLLIFGGLSVPDVRGYSAFVLGLMVMVVMTVYEYNQKDPLINVRLFFGNRTFGFANSASMLNYCATSGVLFLVSMELQLNYGLTSEKAGFVMLAQPLAMAAVTPFAGRMADKSNPKNLAFGGMLIIALVLVSMAFMTGRAELYQVSIMLFILGLGLGLFSTPNNTVIMNSVEKKDYGFASSTLSTMRLMGQTFSIAVSVIILNMFAGSAKIETMSEEGLITALRMAFILFSLICAAGAVMSLAGRNTLK